MSIFSPPITSPPDPGDDNAHLSTEYQEVNNNFRTLADIRFKLLALIPTLSGAGIYILTTIGDPTKKPSSPFEALFSDGAAQNVLSSFDAAKVILIGGLGFLATLGVVYYDQRNSELYNALGSRAMFLERRMKLPHNRKRPKSGGQFIERPDRGRRLLGVFTLGHDTGLALIYAAVLGGWLFPIAFAVSNYRRWGDTDYCVRVALYTTSVAFLIALEEFLRMDRPWRYRLAGVLEWPGRLSLWWNLRRVKRQRRALDRGRQRREWEKRLEWERERLEEEQRELDGHTNP